MEAINIEWSVDIDEMYELFDEMTANKAAKLLEMPVDTYTNMTTEERHDYIYDMFRHCPGWVYDVLNLPEIVEIPEGLFKGPDWDNDDVIDWLSDKYGYCIESADVVASILDVL